MNNLDRVMAFLESEADECPESWMEEGLRELDRMRKIAACFRAGDRHKMVLISQCLFPDDWVEMIERLQEAAKLAEGGA